MFHSLLLSLGLIGALSGSSQANIISYNSPGTENSITYTFTATGGDVSAYFAGTDSNFTDSIGLLVNGVDVGITGLVNHSPTLGIGETLDFGSFAAGSTLVFYLNVADSDVGLNFTYYSAVNMNSDTTNHVYAYTTNSSGVWDAQSGVYIGFEDLSPAYDQAFGGSDFNYLDEQFMVTGVQVVTSAVPEDSTWGMMLVGFAGIGGLYVSKRRRSGLTVSAA